MSTLAVHAGGAHQRGALHSDMHPLPGRILSLQAQLHRSSLQVRDKISSELWAVSRILGVGIVAHFFSVKAIFVLS